MSEEKINSLINIGGSGKAANTFVKRMFDFLGVWIEPKKIRKMAEAEADAALIKFEADIKIENRKYEYAEDFHNRTKRRLLFEETKRQENIENIVGKAKAQIKDSSDPEKMNDDWITNFFIKARTISEPQMQELWSRILAGEANSPGTFSKRTVNFLEDIDQSDARLFWTLGCFACSFDRPRPLIFDPQSPIYNDKGLNFESLSHLESIGLIKYNDQTYNILKVLPEKPFKIKYFDESLFIQADRDGNLPIGKVELTKVGQELISICNITKVDGFIGYLREKLKDYILTTPPTIWS